MTAPRDDDPLAAMAHDLAGLKRDAFGIHAAALEVAALFDRAQRQARRRLMVAIAAASLFAATAAHAATMALGHLPEAAWAVALMVALAAASSVLVVLPGSGITGRTVATLRTWWRR